MLRARAAERPDSADDLWPFLAWFEAGLGASVRSIDWSLLFGQIFLFGAVLWCVRHAGTSVMFAASTMLALTLATEVMQLWVPGQSGSITDLAIALVVAFAFHYVDRRARRAPQVARATPRYGRNP